MGGSIHGDIPKWMNHNGKSCQNDPKWMIWIDLGVNHWRKPPWFRKKLKYEASCWDHTSLARHAETGRTPRFFTQSIPAQFAALWLCKGLPFRRAKQGKTKYEQSYNILSILIILIISYYIGRLWSWLCSVPWFGHMGNSLLLLETKSTFAFAPNNSQNPLCTSVKTRAPSKCDLRRPLVQLRSGHPSSILVVELTYSDWEGAHDQQIRIDIIRHEYWDTVGNKRGCCSHWSRFFYFLFASFWQSKLPLPSDLARFLNINSLDMPGS